MSVYTRVGRSTYLRIDLDTIYNNINILRKQCAAHTDVIAVVKANAYGHGSVEIAKYLESRGISHFAVATAEEGRQLRQAGVAGYIQILGSAANECIPALVKYNLMPTVADVEFLKEWNHFLIYNTLSYKVQQNVPDPSSLGKYATDNEHQVVLKLDTGMSRHGCQPGDLSSLLQYCRDRNLTIHSIMTHFSQAWDDTDFTKQQLNTFMTHAAKYRESGIKLHTSNSAAVLHGYGTDLDFIRPGNCIYGLPPETNYESVERLQSLGIRPALSWLAHPTQVKTLPCGRYIGYKKMYMTTSNETIATFSLGFGDGYWPKPGRAFVSVEEDNVPCPVVGKVSMDAITVRLDKVRPKSTSFRIYTDDFNSPNSITQMALTTDSILSHVTLSLAPRLPRVFVSKGKIVAVTNALTL